MSALLDEIIEAASDSKQPLSDVLRKCLRLGHELKNERLKTWANQELSGYDNPKEVPAYRNLSRADAFGNFSGPFGSGLRNYPIPPAALEERHRAFAEQVWLRQAIGAYEDDLVRNKGVPSARRTTLMCDSRWAATFQPDVALLSVVMPEIGGVEAGIKLLEICPGTKSVLVSESVTSKTLRTISKDAPLG